MLTRKPAEKRHLGRPRRRWEDNIRMDLEEICSLSMRGIGLIGLGIGIIGEPLWMRHWTSGFHKPWSELVSFKLFISSLKLFSCTFVRAYFRAKLNSRGDNVWNSFEMGKTDAYREEKWKVIAWMWVSIRKCRVHLCTASLQSIRLFDWFYLACWQWAPECINAQSLLVEWCCFKPFIRCRSQSPGQLTRTNCNHLNTFHNDYSVNILSTFSENLLIQSKNGNISTHSDNVIVRRRDEVEVNSILRHASKAS